jgi:hypothetical protein
MSDTRKHDRFHEVRTEGIRGDATPFDLSVRYGNNRHMWRDMKVKERRAAKRIDRKKALEYGPEA